MNLEVALNYVTAHSQSIIQWLIVVILLLVGTLIAQALFGRGAAAPAAGAGALADAGELNETLKRLMEQNAAAPAAEASAGEMPAAAAAAPVDAEAQNRVRTLELELQRRDEELAQLRAAGPAAPAGGADPGARQQELEAKLAEYEILEDDIADLSLYKEENTRLRAELEALKGSGAPAEAAEPDVAPVDAPAQPARTSEAAAEAANAFAAFEATAAPTVEAEPAPVPEAEVVPDPVIESTPAAAANEPIPRDLRAEADDLFAEFATALEESGVDLSVKDEPTKTSA